MKTIVTFLLLVLASGHTLSFTLPVRYVYDGDTIMVTLQSLPEPLSRASVRIRGIDAPELRGKCPEEILAAKEAKAKIVQLIGAQKEITISNFKWDKYGSRIDADVKINDIDIASTLINVGLVRKYSGGARSGWCK